MRNDDSPQIPATRHHRRLMTGLCQASHLTESKLSLQKADGLVMETVSHLPTVQPCPVPSEPLFSDVTRTTFAIGQDVKAHGQQVPKQLGIPAAAVKDNGGVPVRPQEFAYFAQHGHKHTGHSGVGIGSDQEQGIAALIVDPIIGTCGCGEMHARHIGLRNRVVTVIGPNMAVNIEEPQHLSTLGDALPSDLTAELIAALQRSETCEFSAQSLHFGHAIQTDNATQFSRRILFESFGLRDPQERQQNIGHQSCSQSVKGWIEAAINFRGRRKQAAGNERWNSQQHTRSWQTSRCSKQRKSIVEKSNGGQETIHGSIERVGIETFRRRIGWKLRPLAWRLLRSGRRNLDQLTYRNRGPLCLRIGFRQEGEIWFRIRIRFPAQPTKTFPDSRFAEAQPPSNPSIAHPLGFEAEHGFVSFLGFLVPGRTAGRGGGAALLEVPALEVPPPGGRCVTVTAAVPAAGMRDAGMPTVNVVALTTARL